MSGEALGAGNPTEVKVSSLNDLFIPNASSSTSRGSTCASVSSALCDPLWLPRPRGYNRRSAASSPRQRRTSDDLLRDKTRRRRTGVEHRHTPGDARHTRRCPAGQARDGPQGASSVAVTVLVVDRHGNGQARRQEIKWRGMFFFVKQWTFPQRRMHYVQYQREMVLKVPITMCSHVVHLVWFVHVCPQKDVHFLVIE